MAASTLAPPVRMARAAVFVVFGLNGFLAAMWVVHIPAITARTHVSNATLGMLILLMAGSGIAGMQAAGPLADRFGSRALVAVAACWLAVAVLGPGLATGPWSLAVALAAFGFGNGALDVSMNTQAVQVEREYPRPIMSSFHALFSCGGLAGSLAGAAALHRDWDLRTTLALAATLGLTLTALCTPRLLPRAQPAPSPNTPTTPTPPDTAPTSPPTDSTPADTPPASTPTDARSASALTASAPADGPPASTPVGRAPADNPPAGTPIGRASADNPPADTPTRHAPADKPPADTPIRHAPADKPPPDTPIGRASADNPPASAAGGGAGGGRVLGRGRGSRKVLALAAVAFALLMTEGVANDWSALQLRERLGVDEATAALAFGAFSTTMTVGRFGADRVSGRYGPVAVVRWGALLAAAGLVLVIASGWVPVTLCGWALLGIGLAGGVPQIFSAAGNLGTATAATDMSRVFGLGYLGFLAGPSVIGWLSEPTSLTTALIFPLALVVLCAYFAPIVDPKDKNS
ncbi:MFS transporter [Nocardia wallacei]|uniref:MFS transporter n=1 Tax=Nocardia wallacei TaxID=480035 RepID=UPI0024561062|nr:MFS transporter [Nocardia wallacei]